MDVLVGTDQLLGFLESSVSFGRSSRYGLRRYSIMHEAHLLAALKSERDAARRGRLLRLLLRLKESRAALDEAVRRKPEQAEAHAWRWELTCAERKDGEPAADFADIDRAVALDPGGALWLAWRACGRAGGKRRKPAAVSRRALSDARAALAIDSSCVLAALAEALALRNLGCWEEALSALDKAVELEPREGWLRRFRGAVRWRLGDHDGYAADMDAAMLLEEKWHMPFESEEEEESEAGWRTRMEAADRFLERRPDAYWMYVFRGDSRRVPSSNDFSGAIGDFKKAVALKPDCSWAWAYLARARMAMGELPEARAEIAKAVELAPFCGWIHIWRGEIERRAGEIAASLVHFDRGLSLSPDYEFGYAWRGGAKRQLGRPKEAIEYLTLAARLDPRYPWTLHERSLALRDMGKVGEAFADLFLAARQDPRYTWCPNPRDFPKALAELDGEISRDPRSAWAYAWKGEILLRMGEPARAASVLARALNVDARNAWARAWLGRAFALLGDRRAALLALNRAIRLDPAFAPSYVWRGEIRAAAGDARGALKDFSQAALRAPTSAAVLESKAKAELALGRCAQAAADFTRAIELSGQYWPALAGRARAYRRLGREDLASVDLAAVLGEAKRRAEAGDLAGARRLYAQARDGARRPTASPKARTLP